jgi:CRP/FNR family transcriptional regulator
MILPNCDNPLRNCLGCEFKSPLFCFLTAEEIGQIDQIKLSVQFRKGETIRKQGTYMSHVLSINSGLAKLYLEGIDQRNAIIRIVKPTNFIGGPGIYLDQLHLMFDLIHLKFDYSHHLNHLILYFEIEFSW